MQPRKPKRRTGSIHNWVRCFLILWGILIVARSITLFGAKLEPIQERRQHSTQLLEGPTCTQHPDNIYCHNARVDLRHWPRVDAAMEALQEATRALTFGADLFLTNWWTLAVVAVCAIAYIVFTVRHKDGHFTASHRAQSFSLHWDPDVVALPVQGAPSHGQPPRGLPKAAPMA